MRKSLCTLLICSVFVSAITSLPSVKANAIPKAEQSKKIEVKKNYKLKTKFWGKEISNQVNEKISSDGKDNVVTFLDKDFLDKSSEKKDILSSINNDLNNNKYILIHATNMNKYSLSDINALLNLPNSIEFKPKDETSINISKRLVAIGIVKNANGNLCYDTYYSATDDTSLEKNSDLITDGISNALKVKDFTFNKFQESDTAKVQDVVSSPSFSQTFNMDFGTYGYFSSTTYAARVSSTSSQSIWDVKQSNTTTGGYSRYASSYWDTDYLYTRMSVENRSGESVIDHGPTTTQRNSTTTVGLDTSGPSVSWAISTQDVSITDDYHAPSYARWINDYKRFSNCARYSYKSEPGIRATNATGSFYIDLSDQVTFWDENWIKSQDLYTGTWTYAIADR